MKRIFILMFLSCLVSALFTITAMAAGSGTCGAEGDGSNLTWTLDDNGTLRISDAGAMQDFSFEDESKARPWPADQGYPGDSDYIPAITSIEIGSGVTSIGDLAFSGYNGITTVNIPSNVNRIGYRAFSWCENLATATIAAANIEGAAFVACAFERLVLSEGVKTIGNLAFAGIKNVVIPSSVEHIDPNAFITWNGYNVTESIEVSSGNQNYFSSDGVLFDKNKSELYIFPCERKDTSFSIPEGIKVFEVETATNFGWPIKSLSVPLSVSKLYLPYPPDSYEGHIQKADIYYAGTGEQWDAIELVYSEDWLEHYNVHFTNAIPEPTPEPIKYQVTISGGSGSGSYEVNTPVSITASIPESGRWFRFKEWSGADNLTFTKGSVTTANATFVMPARDVSITATFDEGFFSEPIYTAPTFGDYVSATSALIHEYQYVEESSSPGDAYCTGRLIVDASKELPDLERFNVAQIVVDNDCNYLLQFQTAQDAKACAEYLKSLSIIKFVEPDVKYSVISTSNAVEAQLKTASPNSWGVGATGVDKYSEQLRESGVKSNIVVAVIDSGVDSSHPFLDGRVMPGYDLVDDDAVPQDGHGHGTHVSGTVVDCTPGLDIYVMPVRVMDDLGYGYDSTIGEGIKFATEQGAEVINMSLGGEGESENIEKWVNYAVAHNVTVVVAAGNENSDTANFTPANYRNCITVSAVDSHMNKATFSNYGDAVDIAAPGVDIKSCIPGTGYDSWDGTSMATPHVAAAAALLLYGNTSQTPAQIEQRLREMATDLGTPGWDQYYGAGFLNLGDAEPIGNAPDKGTPDEAISFSDVAEGAYYYHAVMWAVSEGITNGTTSTTFSPNDTCTTAQILTFMWRAGGKPEPNSSSNTGLSVQSPFYKAVAWANERGIRGAFSTNSPSSPCTRAAAMTYMWNDAGKPSAGPSPFDDVPTNSSYATAVSWGVNRGITNGTTETTFSPDRSCTRAHIITFLYRYYVERVQDN